MVKIAHASKNESGTYKNGKRGDQTGKEVYICNWYSRPWTHVIRAKSATMREKIAYAMIGAANNNYWGYSQFDRNSGLLESIKYGFDPSKVNTPVNCDCSSVITVACIYAGVPQNVLYKNGNSSVTSNLRTRLQSTGLFDVYTDKMYTSKPDKLLKGDILLYENHHVAAVVYVDENIIPNKTSKSISDIVERVINGEYGIGEERRKKLIQEGYNPNEIQAKVNLMLKTK